MAELVVRTNYMNNPRQASLTALKVTFPIWGVAAPITAVGLLVTNYFTYIYEHQLSVSNMAALAGAAALILIFVTGLMLINWLSHDVVVIDKEGVKLPHSFLRKNKALPWSAIQRIAINRPDEKSWQRRDITFFTSNGTLWLGLSHMTPQDVEKLVLAIEMWSGKTELDSSVQDLKDQVSNSGGSSNLLSYTNMWEEELGRRFCPTAFVPLEPGRVMRGGSLKIVRHLALGGLSAVYLAQLDEQKLVVLKEAVVSDDTTDSAQAKAREMLDREAAMLLKLSHANVVKVMDYFVEQGRNYLMLEYINGQDLRQLVKQNGPQRESVVVGWALQMVAILKYLHEQDPPVIHRDFTPDNLVICPDGTIVLIDFGAANEFIGNATGTFVGKHAFIAPEQFRGKAVTQSDIYAFGCTLHFLLTGQEPEALSTSSPQTVMPRISSDLNDLVTCCTQMDPSDRYQTASQLLPILRGLSASLPGVT